MEKMLSHRFGLILNMVLGRNSPVNRTIAVEITVWSRVSTTLLSLMDASGSSNTTAISIP